MRQASCAEAPQDVLRASGRCLLRSTVPPDRPAGQNGKANTGWTAHSPVKGVLIEQLSRGVRLYVAHPELRRVLLEHAYLLLAERYRLLVGLPLKAQEALAAVQEVVPRPYAAYARGAYVHVHKAQPVGYVWAARPT